MRIRTVKPEFWTHPIMGRIDPNARLLALALLNYADDEGYFHADPVLVRAACCPFVDSSKMILGWLQLLQEKRWIELSDVTEHGVIGRVVNFSEHQRIDKPKDSPIKAYWFVDESKTHPRSIQDASTLEGKGREQGKEQGAVAVVVPKTRKRHEYSPDFERWWMFYSEATGNAGDKEPAFRAFLALTEGDRLALYDRTSEWATARLESTRAGNFVPTAKYGQGFINGRGWESRYGKDYTKGDKA